MCPWFVFNGYSVQMDGCWRVFVRKHAFVSVRVFFACPPPIMCSNDVRLSARERLFSECVCNESAWILMFQCMMFVVTQLVIV